MDPETQHCSWKHGQDNFNFNKVIFDSSFAQQAGFSLVEKGEDVVSRENYMSKSLGAGKQAVFLDNCY